jgi:hypothetical protein
MSVFIKVGQVLLNNQPQKYNSFFNHRHAPSIFLFENHIRLYFSSDFSEEEFEGISYIDLNRNNFSEIKNISSGPVIIAGKFGEFDDFGSVTISIANYKNKLIAFYTGFSKCESVPFNSAIGYAISNNLGESFQKYAPGPVISYSLDEPFLISSPRICQLENILYLFYISGRKWNASDTKIEPVYKIRSGLSYNSIEWQKRNEDLIGSLDCESQDSLDIIFFNNKYYMFFSFRDISNSLKDSYKLGYAVSDDLITWQRNQHQFEFDNFLSDPLIPNHSFPHIFVLDNNVYLAIIERNMQNMHLNFFSLEAIF